MPREAFMKQKEGNGRTVIDYITGKKIPDIGPEANRQAVERFLVEIKGFSKENIEVSWPVAFDIDEKTYQSRVDLMICIGGRQLMAIKCAAGSLGSREREILAAARVTSAYQIPFAVVSDGKTAVVLDTMTGKKIGEGMQQIPSKQKLAAYLKNTEFFQFPNERIRREKLIFRSYDSMNVNRS
jgi:hypothetical protein